MSNETTAPLEMLSQACRSPSRLRRLTPSFSFYVEHTIGRGSDLGRQGWIGDFTLWLPNKKQNALVCLISIIQGGVLTHVLPH